MFPKGDEHWYILLLGRRGCGVGSGGGSGGNMAALAAAAAAAVAVVDKSSKD
jgi:hypothetical protein